jgi:signal transduction histidine kinase
MDASKFFFNPNSLLQLSRSQFNIDDAQSIIARISQIRRRIWRHIEHFDAIRKGNPNGIFRVINLKETIEHVIVLDRSKFRSQYAQTGIELDIQNVVLEVDYKRFLTALGELIRNAVFSTLKFSERGTLKTFYALRGFSKVIISAEESEGQVVLSIVDNGIGIPAENFDKIVRYGVSISDRGVKFGGLGVGLPTSILTMEEVGGTLVIESDVSVGTTVTIRIPIN